MNKLILWSLIALAGTGCANHPLPPAWQGNAFGALDAYTAAYLRGDSLVADQEFTRARNELASTGRPELVARAELVRCAVRVASLEFDTCPGFQALAQDASPAEKAYASYLGGNWSGLDPALLPVQHRVVISAATDAKSMLAGIADPLSRLIAAGALLQAGRLAAADIDLASDTASAQGWRRPLLTWLGVQAKRARAAGDTAALARIERRIALAGTLSP